MTKFFAAIGFLATLAGLVVASIALWDKYCACVEDEEIEDEELEEEAEDITLDSDIEK